MACEDGKKRDDLMQFLERMKMKKSKMRATMSILIIAILTGVYGCHDEIGGSYANAGKRKINESVRGKALILTGKVSTIAGTAGVSGTADGIGATASFLAPVGIAADMGNLYVAAGTIRKIVLSTHAVTTLAGSGAYTGSADGIGTAARFKLPMGITTDGKYLYVADSGNHTIRRIAISTGAVTTFAGSAGNYGSQDGVGAAARFNVPYGITTDRKNLYVSEAFNNTIRKIVISTGAVTTLAGDAGTEGAADGVGGTARFKQPAGITTDGINLYVADSGNNTVRKILISNGAVTTVAGKAGDSGKADGVRYAARFSGPTGITTDGTFLYVTDSGNDTIRKIVISTGTVYTLAGTACAPGSADGIGQAAGFNWPIGITTDGKSLYVAEMLNSTIRKIQ
jgi:hypothetical protein